MKKTNSVLFAFLCIFLLSGFSNLRTPHLIVGCFKCLNDVNVSLFLGNELIVSQWYFSSDEFTSHVRFVNKNDELTLNLAYKIFDDKEELAEEGFDFPLILFKNPDMDNFIMVFTIRELQKSGMVFHFEEQVSSENIRFNPIDILFERIAGPPENME